MKVFDDLTSWHATRSALQGTVGFVPTMGALHDGHASLLRQSKEMDDITVLSIYVNPTQFNNPVDLARYPATLAEDLAIAEGLGVDCVILPTYEQIYPDGFRYQISENELSLELCGANRPGHFTGVLTVVMKLLNIVRPQRAYFGKKDYQQFLLVKDMCQAFFLDVDIVGCETVRECDGLAMSSRNKLLTPRARRQARKLHEALGSEGCDATVAAQLNDLGFEVDYVTSRFARRFGAIVVDCGDHRVRLIDNVEMA